MTKEELKHNFINGVMDLRNKGLVEQDSLLDLFEDVIEPCIADLEKENAELKIKKIPQLERRIASIRGSHRVDVKKLNARIEQVERLKKENAELEKRCANYEMKISKMEKGTCDVCKETEKDKKIVELETRCNELFLQTMQLTKAKELLNEFVHHYKAKTIYIENMQDLLEQAEQFLNSEVEK